VAEGDAMLPAATMTQIRQLMSELLIACGRGTYAAIEQLLAMMKSFSCSPLIFLVLRETVA
jgi:hypothetical protein